MTDALVKKAARDLCASRNVAALTGAGISVESGIPPFRGKGGVWEKFDPMEYAHIDAFMRNPEKVWKVFLKELNEVVQKASPNAAHMGLSRLEALGFLKTVITQNVDGLHQAAGNTDVIEFHGTFARHRCLECSRTYPAAELNFSRIPPRCECGGILRPECVFFGEMIPPHLLWRSEQIASTCDILLVVGTSAIVQPAATLPVIAKHSGAKVIEINAEPTALTDSVSTYCILGKAGEIMSGIIRELEASM
ncbi:MAG: NAD-dependent deacylase [Deltaproteobacteria bacterium]|nr:NAD-dependent deacylase [Deltaproteobacteria bacterium]MBW2154314.1 NAD-dependent deacylase [Deltaproteobacteria bacterium]